MSEFDRLKAQKDAIVQRDLDAARNEGLGAGLALALHLDPDHNLPDVSVDFEGGYHVAMSEYKKAIRALNKEATEAFERYVQRAVETEHANHVEFASDIYSTLIDPCAEGTIKEADLFAQCLKAATDQRQLIQDLMEQVTAARNDVQGRVLEAREAEAKWWAAENYHHAHGPFSANCSRCQRLAAIAKELEERRAKRPEAQKP